MNITEEINITYAPLLLFTAANGNMIANVSL